MSKRFLDKPGATGFSVVEVLLAGTILALLALATVGAIIAANESVSLNARRTHAVFLAEEGIEAARNIRDSGFANLTGGIHGLVRIGGTWTFNGTSDTADEYTRQITVTDRDLNRKDVTSRVTWQQNPQRTGETLATTILTNWTAASVGPATCAAFCQIQSFSTGTCRQNVRRCTLSGETNQPLGDALCTGGPSADTCCCRP